MYSCQKVSIIKGKGAIYGKSIVSNKCYKSKLFQKIYVCDTEIL